MQRVKGKREARVVVAATCRSGAGEYSVALVMRGELRVEKAFAVRGGVEELARAVKSSTVYEEISYCAPQSPEAFCEKLGLEILAPDWASRVAVLAERYCEEIALIGERLEKGSSPAAAAAGPRTG